MKCLPAVKSFWLLLALHGVWDMHYDKKMKVTLKYTSSCDRKKPLGMFTTCSHKLKTQHLNKQSSSGRRSKKSFILNWRTKK